MQHFQRVALGITYDGHAYHGWQSQQDLSTVQSVLEQAIARVANHSVVLTCAGRTDAGVHATGQVVHFDTEVERSEYAWVFGVNANLTQDVRVFWAKLVPHEFHARFSAKSRRYRYIIYNHPIRPGILRHAVAWYYKPLNISWMQQASRYLIGEHDFSAFRGAGCQSLSPVRRLQALTIQRQQDLIIVDVLANAFLLHMVRNIVGVLMAVGSGQQSPEWVQTVLFSKDRKQASITAAASGLYLVAVDYSEQFELPVMPLGPFFMSGLS